MSTEDDVLHIAEVLYDTGAVKFRYSRFMAPDGKKWIRHGLFRHYYPNGQLASEGHYDNGFKVGLWSDYHENGTLAAEGQYDSGKMHGAWHYWDDSGNAEQDEHYEQGTQK